MPKARVKSDKAMCALCRCCTDYEPNDFTYYFLQIQPEPFLHRQDHTRSVSTHL